MQAESERIGAAHHHRADGEDPPRGRLDRIAQSSRRSSAAEAGERGKRSMRRCCETGRGEVAPGLRAGADPGSVGHVDRDHRGLPCADRLWIDAAGRGERGGSGSHRDDGRGEQQREDAGDVEQVAPGRRVGHDEGDRGRARQHPSPTGEMRDAHPASDARGLIEVDRAAVGHRIIGFASSGWGWGWGRLWFARSVGLNAQPRGTGVAATTERTTSAEVSASVVPLRAIA